MSAVALRRLGGEAVRFAAVGVIVTAVDLVSFWALTSFSVAPLVANPVSMTVRLCLAFWLTRVWVFADREVRSSMHEAVLFLAVAGLNVLAQEAILWGATAVAGGALSPAAATAVKAVATAVTFAGRFVLSRRYVFRAST